MQHNRFIALDGWRGIAAAMVALHHFTTSGWSTGTPLVRNAYLFVDFFFVLSGFVIAANYRDRLVQGFSPVSFMLLRVGRLYPLHLVMLLAFIATEVVFALTSGAGSGRAPFSGNTAPAGIVTNLLLVQSLGFHAGLTWNGVAWSISAEFWMYAIFAAVLVTWRRNVREAMLALIAGALLIITLHVTVGDAAGNFTDMARCIYGFAVGVLVFDLYEHLQKSACTPKALAAHMTALEIAAVILAAAFVTLSSGEVALFIAPLFFALVVLIFASDAGAVSRLLDRPFMLQIGALSYSIYMIHPFVQSRILLPAGLLLQKLTGTAIFSERVIDGVAIRSWGIAPWHGDAAALAMLVVLLGASWITFQAIEEPGRLFSKRWASKHGDQLTARLAAIASLIPRPARTSP